MPARMVGEANPTIEPPELNTIVGTGAGGVVPCYLVKPWPCPPRFRAGLPYAILALALSVVASCTTVARESGPVASPAAPPTSTASPTSTTGAIARTTLPIVTPTAPATAGMTVAPPTMAPVAASPQNPLLVTPSPTVALAVAASDVSMDKRTTRKLDRILRNTVKNQRVAGLQAAVLLPSGETWLGTAGKAEMTPDRPVKDDTQFAIASVSKTFVAALIMQLAEEGKVDLDAPFGTYFTDAPRSKTVTLRQLLSHTSGIYNFWENDVYQDATIAWYENPNATGLQARDHAWTYEEMMGLVKHGYFKPGAGYHYSNTNYLILRRVAEAVEGKPIDQQLRDRFFKPLGLKDTVYQPAQKPRADAAHGHWATATGFMDHTREASVVPFMAAVTAADAAGAIASSAADLAAWAHALYGGDLLSAHSVAQMTTILQPGLYGLGTDVAYFAGHRAYGHRGGIRGYESSMWYFPESGVSVVLLSNRGNWFTDEPMTKLVKAVLGKG